MSSSSTNATVFGGSVAFIMLLLGSSTAACRFSYDVQVNASNPEFPKCDVCQPNLTCIPRESLPEWLVLTKEFSLAIMEAIEVVENNPYGPAGNWIKISKVIEDYLLKITENPSISCALSGDCIKSLMNLSTVIKKDAIFIETCTYSRNRICACYLEAKRLNLLRLVKHTRCVVEFLIRAL